MKKDFIEMSRKNRLIALEKLHKRRTEAESLGNVCQFPTTKNRRAEPVFVSTRSDRNAIAASA